MLGSPVYGRLAGLLADDPGFVQEIFGDDASWELELRIWPEPARMVARLDFHGNWIEWIG